MKDKKSTLDGESIFILVNAVLAIIIAISSIACVVLCTM